MDVYSSDHGPFMYITQYKLATHLVTMDTATFHQLAESLPHQDTKVVTHVKGASEINRFAKIFQLTQPSNVSK